MKKVLIILLLVTSFASLSQNTAEYKVDEWFKRAEKEIHQNPYKALVYIDSAKIISKTTSGKSADIEISTHGETPRVYEKVRMSNIDVLKWQYRDYVINA